MSTTTRKQAFKLAPVSVDPFESYAVTDRPTSKPR